VNAPEAATFSQKMHYPATSKAARGGQSVLKWPSVPKSAESGHVEARCNLGGCYPNGQGVATMNLVEPAKKWFRKAVQIDNCRAEGNAINWLR
jgi:TPR repeat protein